jgi:hypothetical protein
VTGPREREEEGGRAFASPSCDYFILFILKNTRLFVEMTLTWGEMPRLVAAWSGLEMFLHQNVVFTKEDVDKRVNNLQTSFAGQSGGQSALGFNDMFHVLFTFVLGRYVSRYVSLLVRT